MRFISNSAMEHHQKSDWKLDFPLFSYGYQKCMFADFVFEYIGPGGAPLITLMYEYMWVYRRDRNLNFDVLHLRMLHKF